MSGSRVTRLSSLGCALVIALNLAITQRLDLIFDLGFVGICVAGALLVHPRDFFRVGVLPPMLLLGSSVLLSIAFRRSVAGPGDGVVQGVISGLANHAAALFAGYALALVVLGIRHRVMQRRRGLDRRGQVTFDEQQFYSNLAASPAPYLDTSATPEEKSTTVVGSDPQSPESITASNQ
jgi:hypothetical protein